MTATQYQGAYILIVYVGLALWLGVQFGLFSLLVKRSLSFTSICALASLWTVMEWGRLFLLCGFSFNPVGLSLTCFVPALQLASVFGILGLSFFVMLTNLLFFASHRFFYVIACIPYFFGWLHIACHEGNLKKASAYKALLVQPGLSPEQKAPLSGRLDGFISPVHQWERLFTFVKPYVGCADMIVFPESALPFHSNMPICSKAQALNLVKTFFPHAQVPAIHSSFVTHAFFAQFLARFCNAEVVIGLDHEEEGVYHASAFHFMPEEGRVSRYDKRVLVPLAEYLPFSWIRGLVARYGISSFFKPGKHAHLFLGRVPLAVSICYEETFAHKVREGRGCGANLFVNITNDGWYFPSKLPEQHFFLGRVRAIENGVPLVRACNTGVTGAVDSLGRVVKTLNHRAGALLVEVPSYQYKTLYTLWGDAGIITICFALGLFQVFILAQKLLRRIDFCR